MRKKTEKLPILVDQTQIRVRFSEVDAMKIVWHGEYVRYFEDGRESFGRKYGLSYMDVYAEGYMVPLVDLSCQFKASLCFDETAIVETRLLESQAAKIIFEYIIYRESNQEIVATGSSTQVFLNKDYQLELQNPTFYLNWKKRWNI